MPRPADRSAALFMLGSALGFAAMVVFIRLASSSTPSTEIAFFRNFFGLLTLLPITLRPGQPFPRTRHIGRYLLRTSIGLTSMLCAFWVIAHLPLAQAVSLSYSAPIFVTLGAVFLLREVVRIRRWAAVVAGFGGVLVILQPWGHAFTPAMLVAVLAALLTATVSIQNKQLAQLDPPETVVLYTYLFWVPMSLPLALWQWQWPAGLGWLWLIGTGIFGTLGQLLWVRALRIGEVSALQPISFIQLPVVVLFGWWLFDETPDRWTPIGAAIILAANTYIARREARLASEKTA
ncbi:DMT family transporter [Cephaloticoccus primus]